MGHSTAEGAVTSRQQDEKRRSGKVGAAYSRAYIVTSPPLEVEPTGTAMAVTVLPVSYTHLTLPTKVNV